MKNKYYTSIIVKKKFAELKTQNEIYKISNFVYCQKSGKNVAI